MHQFEETYEKWRNMLLNTILYLALLISIIEFTMYFILKAYNLINVTEKEYLIHYLFIPTLTNLLIVLIGYIALKMLKPKAKYINYIPSVQLALICMVVTITHYIFTATLCVFCIPLFTTVIFSNKKMTMRIGMLSMLFLIISLLFRNYFISSTIQNAYFFAEAIIAFVILITTFFICQVLIKYQMEKSNLIQKGYLRQVELKEQLNKDPKTGLYGYTIFMNTLDKMVLLSENTNMTTALAIIDIDNFKKINDTYGHLKGDKVILRLVNILKNYSKKNYFIARFGGEEFAIIFNNTKTERAFEFLENVRIEFQKQTYTFTNDKITISVGLALWELGLTAENLFDNADSAMYASKENGKNQIKIYNDYYLATSI